MHRIPKTARVIFSLLSLALFQVSCAPPKLSSPTTPAGTDGSTYITFQDGQYPTDGYTGETDGAVCSGAPDAPNSTPGFMKIGYDSTAIYLKERMFIKFDLSAFPAGKQVTQAILTLVPQNTNYIQPGSGLTIYAYALTADFDGNTVTWSNSGINNVYPGNSEDVIQTSTSIGAPSIVTYGQSSPAVWQLNNSTVQGWINNASANHGIVMISNPESGPPNYAVFSSSQNTVLNRPVLKIKYQ